MFIGLIVFLILLLIVALCITLVFFKQIENKMQTYEKEGRTAQDELERSIAYESNSLKSNVPILTWIYSVTFIVAIIALAVYLV
ncbi:hypothetical protein ACFSMW_09895 [Virgibacillus halophilus]|uniref:DUF3899 domain-containing protein n=1 Tax=Tigheibacillus halophilus TaxID=361280 RepID=A0ABU5C640_9BACI|nr:hypothetical protein [Virgibacillus halophilus]